MSEETEKDGILSRWSKRKLEADHAPEEVEAPSRVEMEEAQAELEAELAANREAAESIDLDTIDEDSDLSLFMKDGVPEALKKAALAKLWRSSPVFANIDGLVDYDDNFADPNLILKKFTSAYQIGKGYLKEVLEESEEPIAQEVTEPESGTAEGIAVPEEAEDEAEQRAEEVANIVEIDTEEVETKETETLPRVSLRQRLNLEG